MTTTTVPAVKTARRKRRTLSDNTYGYLFLTPWLVGLVLFLAGPALASLYFSFTDFNLLRTPEWTGLGNYEELFTRDTRFLQSLKVTFIYVAVAAPVNLVFALLVAMLLNQRIRGVGLYRAIYYVPSLLGGSVAIAILWRRIFGDQGIVSRVLAIFGVEDSSWVSDPDRALVTLIILHVWQFGSPMIIFLAGLKQVPPELYEAAVVDGAGAWRRFVNITIPMLTPVIFFNLVLQIINSFQAFTPAFIVSGGTGGPADSTLFYTLYLYIQAFTNFNMGYASAMAWVLLLIIAVLTGLAFLSSRLWVHYEDEVS